MFYEYYCSDGHEGIANWCVTLINQTEDKKERKKERKKGRKLRKKE